MAEKTAEELAAEFGGQEQSADAVAAQFGGQQVQPSLSAGQVVGGAIKNFPRSTYELGKGLVSAVLSPIDTASNVLDLGAGILQAILPEGLVQDINKLEAFLQGDDENAQRARRAAQSVGSFYVERYGSVEGAKRAIAEDPAGVLADASTIFGGGAALPGRIGATSGRIGRAIEPISATTRMAKAGFETATQKGIPAIAGILPGTGPMPLQTAFRAGAEGGPTATMFTEAMRNPAKISEVVDVAKANLQALRQQRSQQYQQGMASVSADPTVLNLDDISSAISKARQRSQYQGVITDKTLKGALDEMQRMVEAWKKLDPDIYHTPIGLDALKQKLYSEVVEKLSYADNANARAATGEVVQAVRGTINSQAPTYAKVMRGYEEASDTIKEIERALSLGNNASIDTSLRKLQSLMRNNVQTNYGGRVELAQQLERAGQEFMPALAGQSLSPLDPRGLGRAALGGSGGYMLASGAAQANPLGLLALLAGSSPRLMGELFYGAGKAYGAGAKTAEAIQGIAPLRQAGEYAQAMYDPQIANYIYQLERSSQGQ
jgi:hypothetical protein